MTLQAALKQAKALFGKNARVEIRPKGAYVGLHGEFVARHAVNHIKGNEREGYYWCMKCSHTTRDDQNNLVITQVWHPAGGDQTSYCVGRIDLGMFFSMLAEGDSFESCFASLATKREKKTNG